MQSMTGYGRGQAAHGENKVVVEMQSVNKRQSEILLSLPPAFSFVETELRAKIDRVLHRGRITVSVSITGPPTDVQPIINQSLAQTYLLEFRRMQQLLQLNGDISLETILRSPGVISSIQPVSQDPLLGSILEEALNQALQQMLDMREREGRNLQKDLFTRIGLIRSAANDIRELQPRVAKRYREALLDRLTKIGLEITLDDERLAREVIFFAERSDFSEELTRLESHLDQFIETGNKEQAIGRALEFISQEIGRELNTLSAKANDAGISQKIVLCKSELEKIREQLQNIE
ncbi:MAG: YicC family protein [Verrucomicrobia bacterium]|nr:YicC family protein [Verrucomicrobiota bacterium]MBV9673413.1 YicC family protein [Verrucomicrobiota bacterium]